MSEFILHIEKLLGAFADPEYRFLVLEPLISYGLLAGIGMLVAGFFMKAPRLQVAALVVIGIAALTYFPYRDARVVAGPRLERVYKSDLPSRATDFATNTRVWLDHAWQFRLLVLCAFSTLMIGIQRNRIGFGLAVVTVLLGFVSMKNSMWLNYQDALAYHPNLKKHEAPIDRRAPAPQSPAREVPPRQSISQEGIRTPATSSAKPVSPAASIQAPRYPDPGTRRVTPPPAPPAPPIKNRRVQPLPHF